jgi:replicative DNA helicase
MASNKDFALQYLKKGLSVIPLYSPAILESNPPDSFKKSLHAALTKNAQSENPLPEDQIKQKMIMRHCKLSMVPWKDYQQRKSTIAEVEQWFTDNPEANIGIVTGKISNLVVFDLDSDEAKEFAINQGGFPYAPEVETGKGFHLYMKHPGFDVRGSVNKSIDLDVRGDGGYVVAPPSVHGSGRIYEWREDLSIFDLEPPECKPWMIEYLKNGGNSTNVTEKTKIKADSTDQRHTSKSKPGEPTSPYAEILKNGCLEGSRNQTATKLTGHLFKIGLAENEIWELVKIWNQKNNPPLGTDELRRTFDSIRKAEAAKKKKTIEIDDWLDTPKKAIAEYDEKYSRLPFAQNRLKIMEKALNGGFAGGRLYIVGGIPSAGKTGLLNNIADNFCLNDQPVLFFSYDDGRSELRYRTFSRFSGFSIEDFNTHKAEKSDIDAIIKNQNLSKIRKNKYVVEESLVINEWPQPIESIQKKHQKPPVIMIDYLRKVKSKNDKGDERSRVDHIVTTLTAIAKKYNTPIIAISELARDSYKSGQRLTMASFKESGTIEYEASWLGILAAVEEKEWGYEIKSNWEKIIEQDGNVDLIVFKAKRGAGKTGKIALKFDRDNMSFRDRIESSKFDSVTPLKKASKFS